MKALIVLGGDPPEEGLIRSEAERADLLIAADRGLAAFDRYGLSPNLLVGDMDSIDSDVLRRWENKVGTLRLPCVKNQTDGMEALDQAMDRGATEIVLLGAMGGRMDHALGNLMLLVRAARRHVQALIRTADMAALCVRGRCTLCGACGDTMSLLPLGTARDISLSGFYYPLAHGELTSTDSLGISNVVVQDEAWIQVKQGDLLMFLYHHGDGWPCVENGLDATY